MALIHALVGEDQFLQLQKLRSIIDSLPANVQRVNLDGATAELAEVMDELRGYAMFAEQKAVVLREADEFVSKYRQSVEAYVDRPSATSILIMRFNSLPKTQRIYKLIAKNGAIEDCNAPAIEALPGWIEKHARSAHGLSVENEAARLLANLIGPNMGRLDSELAKLSLMIDPPAKLRADDVAKQVAFGREQEMWELTNALARGDIVEAMKRWRELMQSDPSSEFRATTWLTMWLEDVRYAVGAEQAGQRVEPRKLWRYKGPQFQYFLTNCRRLGATGLRRVMDGLVQMDRNSKSGVGTASTNVEKFILDAASGN